METKEPIHIGYHFVLVAAPFEVALSPSCGFWPIKTFQEVIPSDQNSSIGLR